MKKRPGLLANLSCLVTLVLPAACQSQSPRRASLKETRPNILFIMSDDHTTQAFGCYGSRLAKLNPTPTLDQLAKGGMRFENVYCNNSICTPSRASIITGQYSQTNGVLDLLGKIAPANQHLALEMKKAGYDTAMIGKWHLKQEPASFDYYCVLPGQGKYFNPQFRIRGALVHRSLRGRIMAAIARFQSSIAYDSGRPSSVI